ncbi:MAG: PIN domain-containing protein [Deltaproteobacteria bacterium]|nr:PIN domain-containing protein [Deltaproteobacteria bacterium]
MSEPVFADASAWVAITNTKDRYHAEATGVYRRLLQSAVPLITSTWTAYEALTIVKTKLGYSQAERLWQRIQRPSVVDLVTVDERMEAEALEFFWKYKDKDWGVVDCASLVIMDEVGCRQAFAFDRHFIEASQQYGFSLVRE